MNDDVKSIMNQVRAMDRSPLRLELLEHAVALADSAGAVRQGFDLRQELMTDALFGGHPEKLLAAFSWCLGHYDRTPEKFDAWSLLWKYKWAVDNLPEYPQIELRQIDETLADMTDRYRRYGASMRTIHYIKCLLAIGLGDREMLREHLPLWKASPRDSLSDCRVCERDNDVGVLIFQGDDAGAVEAAESIVQGRSRCVSVPRRTYARMLLPLLRCGQWARAAECHATGYPRVRSQSRFDHMREVSNHMIYLAIAGTRAKSLKTLERHVRQGLTAPSPLDRYFFHRAATLVLRRAAATGKPVRKLKLPEEFPQRQESGEYALADLAAWFEAETRALAARFDARAGNTYRTDETNALTELEALADSAPAGGESESK